MKSNIIKMMMTLCICTFAFAAEDVPERVLLHMTKAEYTQYLEGQEAKQQAEQNVTYEKINNVNVINTNNVDNSYDIEKAKKIKATGLKLQKEPLKMKEADKQKSKLVEPVSITANSGVVSNSGIVATEANEVVVSPESNSCTGKAEDGNCANKGAIKSLELSSPPLTEAPANSAGSGYGFYKIVIEGNERVSTEVCVQTDYYYYETSWAIADWYTGAFQQSSWFMNSSSSLECNTLDLDPGTYGFYFSDVYGDGYAYQYVNGTYLGYTYHSSGGNWGYGFVIESQSCDDAAACNYGADEACTYASGGFDCAGNCDANLTTVDLYVASYGSEKAWSLTGAASGYVGGCTGGCYSSNSGNNIEDFCLADDSYTLDTWDGYGDGWDGAYIMVYSGGATLVDGSLSAPTGSETVSFSFDLPVTGDIPGCMDASACNYNTDATVDDGSCAQNDVCGVCDGSGTHVDACGVCDGDGWSCDPTNIASQLGSSADTGTLYDDGGPDGNYSSSTYYWYSIDNGSDGNIVIDIGYDMENGYDGVYVCNNTDGTGCTLYSGYGNDQWTGSGSNATIVQSSDSSVNYPGFALTWSYSYETAGCMLVDADNYNPDATLDDGSCNWYAGMDCAYFGNSGLLSCDLQYCVPASWLGDGGCDSYYFECDAFGCDGGDCALNDCNGLCGVADDTVACWDGSSACSEAECPPACTDSVVTLTKFDSLDDSWDGAQFCLNSDCVTLAYGASGETNDFCVDMNAANTITMGGGSYASEHSWELHDANGTLLLSGGDPYNACFGNCGVGGCMESDCPEYSADATYDDGSCSADDCAGVCGGSSVEDACGECGGDGTACAGCAIMSYFGDGYCDGVNNNAGCSQDGGDCCPSACTDGNYSCDSYGGDCQDCYDGGGTDAACNYGCDDADATNYDSDTDVNDGSCEYPACPVLGEQEYVITVGGGNYLSEHTWSLSDANGASVASGGDPYAAQSCLSSGDYVLSMCDQYSDGWDGSTFSIEDGDGNGHWGLEPSAPGGWSYGCDDVTITLPGNPPPVYGCMLAGSSNYDADATADDASCLTFPGASWGYWAGSSYDDAYLDCSLLWISWDNDGDGVGDSIGNGTCSADTTGDTGPDFSCFDCDGGDCEDCLGDCLGSDESCYGCTDDTAENYDADATINDGSCTWNGGCGASTQCGSCCTNYCCDGSTEFGNATWGPDCSDGSDEGEACCGDADGGDYSGTDCADLYDCNGTWNGSASVGCDGVCGSGVELDACGNCGGDCAESGGGCEDLLVNGQVFVDDVYGDTCAYYENGSDVPNYWCQYEFMDGISALDACCSCGGGETAPASTSCGDSADNAVVAGCDGVCDSGLSNDECGECGGSGIGADECDCAGNTNDCCDECGGDNSSCIGTGDVNGGGTDVTDLVAIIDHILQVTLLTDCAEHEADFNGDGTINVNDIVGAVTTILGLARDADIKSASYATVIQSANGLSYETDGFVGFEITLRHGVDFELNVTKAGLVGQARTTGTTTKLVVINNETSEIFSSKGEFEIVEVLVATTGDIALTADVVVAPKEFGIADAYPNPFNPATSVELSMPIDGFVSVKIYNLTGQEVANLHEGNLSGSTMPYSFTWNASSVASGMYFVRAESAGNVDVQKIMFMK